MDMPLAHRGLIRGRRAIFCAVAMKEPKMKTPAHIEFQGMEPQEVLRAAIARHVTQLEKRFGRITACRVVLKGPGEHHRSGGLFEVHIRLALPDEKEVNVGHKADADERHADANLAINDAFKHARRRLQEQVRRLQGHVKTHESRAEAALPTNESAADKTSN
jgi:ribosome-associated translation inhibitor RaiA